MLLRLAFLFLLLGMAPAAGAGEQGVVLHLFWRVGCPHCEREQDFLRRLQAEIPQLRVADYELGADPANRERLLRVAEALRADMDDLGVPYTVVGGRAWVGYWDDATTGAELREQVLHCLRQGCEDPVPAILSGATRAVPQGGPRAPPGSVRLPLFGEVAVADLSLPLVTVVLGALDGFNPCAMWTLVFLIGLLVGMRDSARMWTLGSAFILASALAYWLFMAAWLNLLLFIGLVFWVRLGVGVLAVAGGLHYLREFRRNPAGACPVTRSGERRRVFERLRAVASQPSFLPALAGIVALAFAVNLVELVCSAGIPAVYTQVLALSDLSPWQYHAYIAVYILVFMLDDLVVFVAAMKTLQVAGLTAGYSRWSHLVGGLVLLVLGLALIFRPQWLSFA